MTVDELIHDAQGNGKSITVYRSTNRVTGDEKYLCEVQYTADRALDFTETKHSRADASRWFGTWSKLAD